MRDVLRLHLTQTVRVLVIDEIFDANALDLSLVRLAADAGLDVTVVGDPWQALYGFRGAARALRHAGKSRCRVRQGEEGRRADRRGAVPEWGDDRRHRATR
ncbi:UvrD-helicase domain-containing protein [Streptomyces macrosporus]